MSDDNSKKRAGTVFHDVSFDELEPGDHIYAYRCGSLYSHHGIYAGEHEVIHFSGQRKEKSTTRITISTLEEFCNGSKLRLVAYDVCFLALKMKRRGTCHKEGSDTAEDVLERAMYYLAHPNEWPEYDLRNNNCEHFAFYCKTGRVRNPDGQSGKFETKGVELIPQGATVTTVIMAQTTLLVHMYAHSYVASQFDIVMEALRL